MASYTRLRLVKFYCHSSMKFIQNSLMLFHYDTAMMLETSLQGERGNGEDMCGLMRVTLSFKRTTGVLLGQLLNHSVTKGNLLRDSLLLTLAVALFLFTR